MSLRRAWTPYVLLAALLLASRIDRFPLKGWLQAQTIEWRGILGTEVGVSVAPLYLPGTFFVAVALLTLLLHRMRAAEALAALKATAGTLAASAAALGTAVPMVRIFIHSDGNAAGLPGMPMLLAAAAADLAGPAWPLAAPFVGAFGAFLAGSATFSNMMFASFQLGAAERTGLVPEVVLAAQMLGANAGNMISVLNVVAAAAVVGLLRQEGTIIRFTVVPMLLYCLAAGALALAAAAWAA
jgi:lactate permease